MTTNSYSYANGNPTTFTDRNGRATISLCAFLIVTTDPTMKGAKGATTFARNLTITCSGRNEAELSFSIDNGCQTVTKWGPGDPGFGGPPRPTTYDGVVVHETGHTNEMNECVSRWTALHAGDEGYYCTKEKCMAKAHELSTDFDRTWDQCAAATKCKWGDVICDSE